MTNEQRLPDPIAVAHSTPQTSIAILGTRGIPARYGGFETFAEQLATGLVSHGISVTVFCEADSAKLDDQYNGVCLQYVKLRSSGHARTILFDLECLYKARTGYDVVYLLGYGAAWASWIPRIFGTEVWINPDGVEWARAKWGALAKLYFKAMEWCACRFPDRIIADSASIAAHLRARHSLPKPVSVIPYGAHSPEQEPSSCYPESWGLKKHGYYLIVCRLEPENHIQEMITGFLATATQRPLVILGHISTKTSYVASLLVTANQRVRFLGTEFNAKNLQALRYWAYAYCHGHSVGGTNPSLLEALACSNSIIAHDNPHNREVAGDCALYFNTSQDFQLCVDRIDADVAYWHRTRSAAEQRASTHYTWDIVVRHYADLLLNSQYTAG